MSPENYLPNYLLKFQELYACTTFLDMKFPEEMKEINLRFERALSQLKLLSMVHEKYVIAVAGFQGAGKTTLMNWLLFDDPKGIDDRWLPENQGVGENLPVLITCENERNKIEAIRYEVQKKGDDAREDLKLDSIKETVISSPEETQKIVNSPQNTDLLIELFIPMPSSLASQTDLAVLDQTSFMLLPGYEKIHDEMDEEKKYRQEYMRLVLKACANSLVVMDPRTVMQQHKEDVVKEIISNFDSHATRYVFTHMDETDGTGANSHLQENFKIPESRIVHTGTMTDNFTRSNINEWRCNLVEQIKESSKSRKKTKEVQKRDLKKLLRECSFIITKIKRLKKKLNLDNNEAKVHLQHLHKIFEDSLNEIRSNYLNIYNKKIEKIIDKVYTSLDETIKNRGDGEKIMDWARYKWKGPEPIKNIVETFNNEYKKKIEDEGGEKALILKIYNATQNSIGVYDNLKIEGDFESLKEDAIEKITPKTKYQLNEGIIRNIQFVAGTDSIHKQGVNRSDPDRDLENAMELIPYIIFDTQRFQLVSGGEYFLDILINNENKSASDSFKDHFENIELDTKSFMAGIAALAGADLLPDGELDSIGSLFSALFGGEAAGEGGIAILGGSSVLGLMTSVAVGLLVFKSMNDAAVQHGLKKVTQFKEISTYKKDSLKTQVRDDFDRLFQRVWDLIDYRIRKYTLDNYDVGYLCKLENRIRTCETAGIELKSAMRQEV